MADGPNLRSDGEPDGRGKSEGSKSTQFAAGDDRRRPGRPKGAKSLRSIYRAAGKAKISVTVGGVTRRLTKTEAVILKQLDLALHGEQRPAERFLDRIEQYTPVEVDADLIGALIGEDMNLLAIARERGLICSAGAYLEPSPSPDSASGGTDEAKGADEAGGATDG